MIFFVLLLASQIGIFAPSVFVPQMIPVTPMFVSGALSGTTINGSTNTALGTQGGTINGPCPNLKYCMTLSPLPVLPGNGLFFVVELASTATTLSATDDKGDSFNCGAATAAESSKVAQLCYICAPTTGASQALIAETTGTIIYDVLGGQLAGVPATGCLDTSNSNVGSATTTPSLGSVTPTQANDLIVGTVFKAGTPLCTALPCYTAGTGQTGITWAFTGTDYNYGGAQEWGVYSLTSALNPAITILSSTFIGVTAAFKTSNNGTDPSGMYPRYQAPCYTPATAGSTQKCQFPSAGNLLTMNSNGAGPAVTGVTDTGNTWRSVGVTSFQDETAGTLYPMSGLFYAPAAVADGAGDLTFAINTTHPGDLTIILRDWVGAATVPLANRQTAGGNGQTAVSNLTYLSSFLPGMTTGWCIGNANWANGTASAVLSPSGAQFVATTWGGQSTNGPSYPFQNEGDAILANSLASAQAWEYGYTASVGTGVGAWGGEAECFMAAAGSFSGPSILQSPYVQATSGTTLTDTLVASQSGTVLVAVIGNQAGSRTVTKVCTDGTTCGTGNSFTKVTGATCTDSALGNEGEIWYLMGHAAGVTAVEATISGTISNSELKVLEIRNITTLDSSAALNNGAGVAGIYTGPSITLSGSPSIAVSNIVIDAATGLQGVPASGNVWGYDGAVYSDGDGSGALIAGSGSYAFAGEGGTGTNGFCSSAAAFK